MGLKVSREKDFSYLIKDGHSIARVIGTENIINQAMGTEAITQLLNMAELPGKIGIPIGLPDIHQGYGFPIGSVIAFDSDNGIVSPGGVGYDINCGVALMNTGMDKKTCRLHTKDILKEIFNQVPVGMARSRNKLSRRDIEAITSEGIQWLYFRDMATEDDINKTDYNGSIFGAEPANISEKAYSRGMNFFGTLGSGNHFIELQFADQIINSEISEEFGIHKDMVYVMIHTGSRGLGHQVATDYIQKIRDLDHNKRLKDAQLSYMELSSRDAERYISAMNGAANYGFANRQMIISLIRNALKKVMGNEFVEDESELVYNISHNIAAFEENDIEGRRQKVLVHRKGATRALPPESTSGYYAGIGHPVIVPGSMGTASYVLRGVGGNSKISFSTSCHGAGRVLGRKMAKEKLSPELIEKELEALKIEMKFASTSALTEEAPESYKNIDEIYNSIVGGKIAEGIARLKPIGVIKG